MATAEGAPDALGPRYAPADPTLPEPWKGLIDGSTGVLYYWNPETNITQYEKPTALPPPLPLGPPPVPSTPKLAPIPGARTVQSNGVPGQQVHQITQHSQPQGQQMTSLSQQHPEQMPQVAQQGSSQLVQVGQQLGSQAGPSMQQLGQLTAQHPRPQMMLQPNQQMFPSSEQQMPPQQGNQIPQIYQGGQMGQPQGYQYPQQMRFMGYQQNMPQQGPPNLLPQTQHSQQIPQQPEHKAAFLQREDVDFQQGKQVGFSPSIHQSGVAPPQNLSAGTNSIQPPPSGVPPSQASQYSGSSFNLQQPSSLGQLQQGGMDLGHQHAPRFQNQMGPSLMHGQQPNVPLGGLKVGYEENPAGRGGSDHYFNAKTDGLTMSPHQPKLAAIPMARNQQDTRMGGLPLQNVSPGLPGGVNPIPGTASHGVYSHPTGGAPFPSNALMRPPPAIMSSPDAINLSSVDVYRQKHDVSATGDNVPAPFMSFEATGFPPEILREIHAAGFASPTPIQAQTWPIALQNRDIVAIAKTGSGKTLGYLIPAFMLLRHCRNNPQNGPTVVVLAPTRELATQIQDEAIKFGRSSRVSCTCLYGGAPKGPQLKELERGADIVVATPGRLNDILEMKRVDFRQVSLLVLDEADRMLDMGFEPQIRKIVNEIPPRRQTLMYTATWPKEVRKIAGDLLVNPVQVNIGNADELAANKSITQYVEVVPHMEKQRRVEQILQSQERGSKIIIFCSTKKLCDQLAYSIGRKFGAAVIHGDKSQEERDRVLNQFRSGKSPILVATDVAARGLDVKDVRIVINYDFPTGVEDYVHRIGRTGRAGAKGVAYTFFSEQDWKYAADLIKVLEGANQPVPPEVRDIATRGGPSFGKDRVGMSRFDSGGGGGRWDSGGGRGGFRDGGFGGRGGGDMRDGRFGGRGGGEVRDGRFGGRGGGDTRDGGFGSRGGGMRDGGFGGRSGGRDEGFGGRGGQRDGGFGGRGGARDGGFGGRGGMRDGNFGGRGGSRGGGFGGRDGGWDRNDRGPHDRFVDGRGRGRGRGRFDNRRDVADRSRGRSYSSSPERVRTWGGYSRSRSRSRSWSSRSRSWSRSRSPRRSRSRSPRRSRSSSYSRSPIRRERRRESKFDQKDVELPAVVAPPKPDSVISPMSPGKQSIAFSIPDSKVQLPLPEQSAVPEIPEAINQFTEP